MKTKKIIVLCSVGIAAIILTSILYYTFRASPDSMAKQKPDHILSAIELVNTYETDETTANSLYLDKVVQVSGQVVEVSEEKDGKKIISLKGSDMGNVSCLFSANEIKNINLKEGDMAEIKGKCAGYILDVALTKCTLVK